MYYIVVHNVKLSKFCVKSQADTSVEKRTLSRPNIDRNDPYNLGTNPQMAG